MSDSSTIGSNLSSDNANPMRAISRVMQVLYSFSRENPELALKDICIKTGLPKATVYRILNGLKEYDMIHQDNSGVYRLGFGVVRLSSAYVEYEDIRKSALPVMQQLSDISLQTSNLYVLVGNRRLCIQQVLGPTYIPKYSSLGKSHPLYIGASGKVLLAYMEKEEREKYLSDLRRTEASKIEYPYDEDSVRNAIDETLLKGYCCTMAERDHYTASIAAPIFDWSGKVNSTITISGPVSDFTEEQINRFASLVKQAANNLSNPK